MPAPQSLVRKRISKRLEKRMLRRLTMADHILTSSGKVGTNGVHPGFREYLEQHGYASTVIENRPNVSRTMESKPRSPWCIGYLGRVREVQPFQHLLQSVLSIKEENRPSIRIAGDGVAHEEVRQLLERTQVEHKIQFEMSGAFDSEQFYELIQEVDVMYALYRPDRGNIMQGAIPVKMFDAAAFGVPSVVNSDCLMGEVAESEGIGIGVKWMDTEGLTKALQKLKSTKVQLNTGSERERLKFVAALEPYL